MKKDGAFFGYLFYANPDIPIEDINPFRTESEDKILAKAKALNVADDLGGATGIRFSYIDFLVYDIDTFIPIVIEVATSYGCAYYGFSEFIYNSEPLLLRNK